MKAEHFYLDQASKGIKVFLLQKARALEEGLYKAQDLS